MNTKEMPLVRASEQTRRQLKIIAALADKSMQEVMAQLVKAEYERITKESNVKC